MRVKRSVTLTACSSLLTLSLALTGCGGKQVQKTTADGRPIITIGRSTVPNPKLPDGDTYEDNAYTRLVEKELGIDLVDAFEASGDEYGRQVSLGISSGELPDIVSVGGRDELRELYENDLIADLTDVYEKYATQNIKDKYESYDGRCLDNVTIDGRLYGLPSTALSQRPGGMVWLRSDWIEELNLTVDEDGDKKITIGELEEIAKAFMKGNPEHVKNVVGIACLPNLTGQSTDDAMCLNSIAYAMGAMPKTWYEEDGKVKYGSTDPEMVDFLKKVNEWYETGLLDHQFGTRAWDEAMALLNNGQTGIAFGQWHMPDWGLNNVRSLNPKANFEVYAIENEDGKIPSKYSSAAGGAYVVSKECEHPEVAIQILNLMNDDDLILKAAQENEEIAQYEANAVDNSTKPFNMVVLSNTSLLDDYAEIEKGISGELPVDQVRTLEGRSCIASVQKYLKDPVHCEVPDWAKYHSRCKGIELFQNLMANNDYTWLEAIYPETTDTMETNMENLNKLEEELFMKIVIGEIEPEQGFKDFVAQWNELGGEKISEEIAEQIK